MSALELEKAVRRGNAHARIQVCLAGLIQCLTILFDRLRTVLPENRIRPEASAFDRNQTGEILMQLGALLETDDTKVNDVIDRWGPLLIGALGDPARRLENQIQNFDYGDALSTLKDIQRNGFFHNDTDRRHGDI